MAYCFNDDKSRVDFSDAFDECYAAKYQLLWTNPNPSQDFAETVITLPASANLTDYKYIDIVTAEGHVLRINSAYNVRYVSAVALQQIYIEVSLEVVYLMNRDVEIDIDNNTIIIYNCGMFDAIQPSTPPKYVNSYLVPIKIYGVKL